jgi:hypothetical protein
MLKLVILFHVEMARSYVLDLATLKSYRPKEMFIKKAGYPMSYFGYIIT